MKKYILLCFALVALVSKSQVVGGYIPKNSSQTATMGGLKVNGTGTFNAITIPSNSTATQFSITSDQSSNVLPFVINGGASANAEIKLLGKNNSRVILTNTATSVSWYQSNNTLTTGIGLDGFSIGTSADPNAGFLTIGSSGTTSLTAFALASVALTAGNPGAIATLTDVSFSTVHQHASYNPADGLTIYFGFGGSSATPVTNPMGGRVFIPYNATLIGYDLTGYVLGTPASAETSSLYVRVDNTTDITLNTSVTYSVGSGFNEYHSLALGTNINAGSYVNIKWITPTWVTNPTSLTQGVTLWFRRRL